MKKLLEFIFWEIRRKEALSLLEQLIDISFNKNSTKFITGKGTDCLCDFLLQFRRSLNLLSSLLLLIMLLRIFYFLILPKIFAFEYKSTRKISLKRSCNTFRRDKSIRTQLLATLFLKDWNTTIQLIQITQVLNIKDFSWI